MRHHLLLVLLLLLSFLAAAAPSRVLVGPTPLIIIPGTAGSRLEARLDKPSTTHWYCHKKSDWYTLWLDVPSLLPPAINCWVDNIKLLYNASTRSYTNNLGVFTRTPWWGATDAIEYLDPNLKVGDSDYFHDLVEAFVAAGGVRNKTVRGAPYDFRRAPTSAYDGMWLDKMTQLVESTAAGAGGRPVVLLSHSMGCLYTLWFLNQKDDAWKEKYVAHWIATSGVFAGAGTGVVQLVSGSSQGVPGVSGITVRDEQRSYESSMILLPTPQVWGDFPFVRASYGRNFSAREYGDLFAATHDFAQGLERYNLLANLTAELRDPNVSVTHMYGTGVDTPTAFEYTAASEEQLPTAFRTGPARVVNGDGDGTVPLRSLQSVEKRWQRILVRKFANETHTGILKSKEYISTVLSIIDGL